jgi:Ca2+-binding RTX toxin-like protein
VLTGNTNGNLIWGNGGNDIINGMGGNDILVGGSGTDMITAGAGENLLLGGSGSDTISGGTGQDILFNGTTTFDNDGTTQNLILTFWANTAVSFATRVSELRAGTTGVTGMPTLDSTNVFNDTSSDTLTGGGGLDWFFAKLSGTAADSITDLAGGDALN